MKRTITNKIFLSLISDIYKAVIFVRNSLYDIASVLSRPTGRPTISIGALHAGGTGKTPMCMIVAKKLIANGYAVAILSRGYGRKNKKPVIIGPKEKAIWSDVGDEPAMIHAAFDQTWLGIGTNRLFCAKLLNKRMPGKSVFILDDGFQHRKIARDFDIVCLPPNPFEEPLIPLGCLREPFANIRRCSAVCLIGQNSQLTQLKETATKLTVKYGIKQVFILYQKPLVWINFHSGERRSSPPLRKPILICGIARPHRFVELVLHQNIAVYRAYFFRDHHVFSYKNFYNIPNIKLHGVITTEKDAARMRTIPLPMDIGIWYLSIELQFIDSEQENHFFLLLKQKLGLL